MKLYLVARTDDVGYDEYDSFVCAAQSEDGARNMTPYIGSPEPWVIDTSQLKVQYLGITDPRSDFDADYKPRIILASFNAG